MADSVRVLLELPTPVKGSLDYIKSVNVKAEILTQLVKAVKLMFRVSRVHCLDQIPGSIVSRAKKWRLVKRLNGLLNCETNIFF